MKRLLFTLILTLAYASMYAQTSVTVTGITLDTLKVFDASDSVHVTNQGTLVGVAAGDTVTLLTVAHYSTIDAGSGITITVTSSLHGPDSALYVLSNPDSTLTGTIARRQLYRDSIILAPVKVYDGMVDCQILFSGVAHNYVTHHILTTIDTCLFFDPNVGNNKPVRLIFGLSGEDVDNYLPPHDTILYSSIVRRKLLTTNTSIQTIKPYNGTADAIILGTGWLSNVVEGDTVLFNLTAAYDDKNAGTGKIIRSVFDIYGPDTMNYSAPDGGYYPNSEISYLQLTADGGSAEKTKTYDGTTSCKVVSSSQPVGVLAGEQVFVNTMATYDNPNVGNNHVITFSYTIYGDDALNYLAPPDSIYCTDGVILAPAGVDDVVMQTAVGPDPFADYVQVLTHQPGMHDIFVYNVSGMLLLHEVFTGDSLRVDVSAFRPGLYLFVVDGKTTKLIKQ